LLALLHHPDRTGASSAQVIDRVRELFTEAGVFAKAEKLIEKYRARAEALADEVAPAELRELLYCLVDSVLDRQPPAAEPVPLIPLTVAT
jgi:geranylgeranyl pyrophosphate synthase